MSEKTNFDAVQVASLTIADGDEIMPIGSPAASIADPSIDETAPVALTATAPSGATATNPTAPTAYSALSNLTDPVTKTEGEAISAALATLRGEVAAYELVISALVVDNADLRTKLAAAIVDLAAIRTRQATIITDLGDLADDTTTILHACNEFGIIDPD